MAQSSEPPVNPFDEPRIVPEPDEFFETYQKHILGGAAALLLIFLGGLGFWFWQQNREAAAMEVFTQAVDLEDFQQVAGEFPETRAGAFALLESAKQQKEAGNWAAAVESYSAFVQKHGNNPLAPTAELGLARALEGAEDWDAAQNAYLEMINTSPPHPFSPAAHVGLARVYSAQGEIQAARRILSDLLAGTTRSAFVNQAEQMLLDLPTAVAPVIDDGSPADAAPETESGVQ